MTLCSVVKAWPGANIFGLEINLYKASQSSKQGSVCLKVSVISRSRSHAPMSILSETKLAYKLGQSAQVSLDHFRKTNSAVPRQEARSSVARTNIILAQQRTAETHHVSELITRILRYETIFPFILKKRPSRQEKHQDHKIKDIETWYERALRKRKLTATNNSV